ncbi:MAG: hypothetical protein A3F11_03650 [Gammaproteobacteria bacterium RIFCSPHIGHO2_12_FULL_37_14]|nr:MAG: hypothetical protein A3F11_03650 [Gammaproteobacteria bacterium RIFCSPHIGHO2_12_FULL_37_14]
MDTRASSQNVQQDALISGDQVLMIPINQKEFTCPVTMELFFEPVMFSDCEHCVEGRIVHLLKACPECRNKVEDTPIVPVSRLFKNTLELFLTTHSKLYAEVYFNLDHFEEVVNENELNTPTGGRFIQLLQHAPYRLTEKAIEGTQKDKTAIEILITTEQGCQVLRDQLSHVLTPELLQLEVNGKTIADWMKPEEKTPESFVSSNGLFAPPQMQPLRYPPRRSANNVWQCAAYADEAGVLQRLRENPDLVKEKGTACDFVGRNFIDQTCYQIALRGLPDNDLIKGIKDIYLGAHPDGQAELTRQYNEVFPDGHDAYLAAQKANVFNFDSIINAIKTASRKDVRAALDKRENGSKLYRALNEYRLAIMQKMLSEDYNPYHFEKLAELIEAKFDELELKHLPYNHPDHHIHLNLLWCQVVGAVQFYDSAVMGQARCTGLENIVINGVAIKRKFKLHNFITFEDIDYFSDNKPSCRFGWDYAVISYSGGACIGVENDLDDAATRARNISEFLSSSNSKFQELIPRITPHREREANCIIPNCLIQ